MGSDNDWKRLGRRLKSSRNEVIISGRFQRSLGGGGVCLAQVWRLPAGEEKMGMRKMFAEEAS